MLLSAQAKAIRRYRLQTRHLVGILVGAFVLGFFLTFLRRGNEPGAGKDKTRVQTARCPKPPQDTKLPQEAMSFPEGNLLIMVARGGHIAEPLTRHLLSLQCFAPETFVAVVVDEAVSESLRRQLHNSPLRIRAYSWADMQSRLPDAMKSMLVNAQRMYVNAMVIADYRSGGTKHQGQVIWQLNMNQPDGFPRIGLVALVDARDVVFQGDPWEPLRREVKEDLEIVKTTGGKNSRVRLGPDGVPEILVSSQEPRTMSIGRCPYNSKWIVECYGSAALEVVENWPILCSGLIFGTIHAVESYMKDYMVPACVNCMKMEGWEQGPHNFLLHYAADPEKALGYGKVRDVSSAAPTVALAERMASQMRVIIEPAEDDWLCTVGYMSDGALKEDEEGFPLSVDKPTRRCRVMHQFDRFKKLEEGYEQLFPLPARLKIARGALF
jgi:hypothetical protein